MDNFSKNQNDIFFWIMSIFWLQNIKKKESSTVFEDKEDNIIKNKKCQKCLKSILMFLSSPTDLAHFTDQETEAKCFSSVSQGTLFIISTPFNPSLVLNQEELNYINHSFVSWFSFFLVPCFPNSLKSK